MKRDYFWNSLGVFAQNAISPLLLIVVTRINGIGDSGIFSFAFSIAIILWALGLWGGRTYQVSDVKREFSSESYILGRIILAVIMLTVAAVFSIMNSYDTYKLDLIVLLAFFKALESIADALYGVLQIHNRLYIAGRSLFYKAVLGFIAFTLIDITTKNLTLSVVGLVVVNIALTLGYDVLQARKVEKMTYYPLTTLKKWGRHSVKIIVRCAPIAAVIFLTMFALNIPRYFLDKYHPEEIGYFGIIAMPVTLLALFISFILQPNILQLTSLFSKHKVNEFDAMVRKILTMTLIIGSIVLVGVYLVGAQLLSWIFAVDFSNYKSALFIITLGAIVNAVVTVFINVLIIARSFKSQFYAMLLSNVIAIIACIWSIPHYGIMGASVLYLLVNMLQVLVLTIVYKKKFVLQKAKTV